MKTSTKLLEAYQQTIREVKGDGIIIPTEIETMMKMLMINIGEKLDKPAILKIKRSEDAKQFPLIHHKKFGDVGFDLPAIMPYLDGINKDNAEEHIQKLMNKGKSREQAEKDIRKSIFIHRNSRMLIPTGIRLEIPEGYWTAIEARSSTSKLLTVIPKGVIDQGYRGELFAVGINVGENTVKIEHGDRIVQMIVKKTIPVDIVEVDEISDSERGDSGFGSTGK